jgi:hypothetical protein
MHREPPGRRVVVDAQTRQPAVALPVEHQAAPVDQEEPAVGLHAAAAERRAVGAIEHGALDRRRLRCGDLHRMSLVRTIVITTIRASRALLGGIAQGVSRTAVLSRRRAVLSRRRSVSASGRNGSVAGGPEVRQRCFTAG